MALKNVVDTELAAKRLADWLAAKQPDAQGIAVTDVQVPGAGGLSNETVLFTANWHDADGEHTRGMVARVQPDGPGVFPDYDLSKEAAVIGALAEHSSVPVPAVYYLEDDLSVFGAPFLVMQRIDGRIPADDPPFTATGWVLEATPEQRRRMWHNSIDVLAQIHDVDWRAIGLDFLDTPEQHSGLDAGLAQWRRTFEWAAAGEPNPTLEAALRWLDEHRPQHDEPKVLNWGDARVGNMIYTPELIPVGVLDWEMVNLASREQDLGWWLFLMRHHTEGVGLELPAGIPDHGETIAYYEQVTGHQLRDLQYYEVLAGTRLSILMVRAAHMMIDAGLLPPDSPMAQSNPASQLVAKLLDLPAPTGATTSFIGNRG
ncbi:MULTISPECIES: phosphotransferase family protein [Mycobacterium]|nr:MULTISPECIES: phosphotransferase family protein [Mycobacterium]